MKLSNPTTKYETLVELFVPGTRPVKDIEKLLTTFQRKWRLEPPIALLEYLRVAGNLPQINTAHNRLLTMGEQYELGGFLVFYEEAQAVVVWGFDYTSGNAAGDPVVFQSPPGEGRWTREYRSMSDFFVSMFYWQAVNGGLPFGGNLFVDSTSSVRIGSDWMPESLTEHGYCGGLQVYFKPGQIVCVSETSGQTMLHGAASTNEQFESLTDSLGVSWLGTWSPS